MQLKVLGMKLGFDEQKGCSGLLCSQLLFQEGGEGKHQEVTVSGSFAECSTILQSVVLNLSASPEACGKQNLWPHARLYTESGAQVIS